MYLVEIGAAITANLQDALGMKGKDRIDQKLAMRVLVRWFIRSSMLCPISSTSTEPVLDIQIPTKKEGTPRQNYTPNMTTMTIATTNPINIKRYPE